MRILTRYILREVLSHALIGAAIFTFVIFMRDLGRILEIIVRNSAPIPSVAELFFLTIPTALTITIPMAVLVGILIGLSRLAADSEVTAMRAIGLGSGMFLRVIAIFAFLAWTLALVNNVYIAPRSAAALASLQNRLASSQASFEIQPRVFYEDFKDYVLYVEDVLPGSGAAVWKNVFLADLTNPAAPKVTLARRGIVTVEGDKLRLHLSDGSSHETDPKNPEQYSISTFNESDIPIQLPAANTNRAEIASPAEVPTAELLSDAGHLDPAHARLYQIEFHRRFALPTACLVLALVGIPLGLSAKKGGKSTGFVLTIALVFLYYLISLTGMSLARQGRLPVGPAMWLGNIVFFIGGLLLLYRVDRMPIEIGTMRGFWSNLRLKLANGTEAISARRRSAAFERALSRKRFLHTRFPLLIDDYVLRDFLLYLGMVIGTFLMLVLVFTFFELLKNLSHVPLYVIGEYLVTVTPYFLYNTTPISMLLAVLITFGLFEKSSEITAMKASGMSIYRVILPVLVTAAIVAGGLFFFDQLYLPQLNKKQDALLNEIKGKPPQTYLRPDRKWIFGQHSTIYYFEFFDPDQDRFGSISAFEFDPHTFQLVRRIHAQRAYWSDSLQRWTFENGWERVFQGEAVSQFRSFDVTTFAELNEPPPYFKKEVKQSLEMNYEELHRYINDLAQSGFDVIRLRVQLHKKLAFPVMTFVMAVLAVPFALRGGRRGALTGIATAIGIAIVYWVGMGFFEAMGNANQLPAVLAAWSPDLLFGLVGGYLLLKVPT
ncbi:MAG TPA: LPS export ABC transporter permease LptF [Terriglobales bacterium]|nr:LPS export ABC transporter permease LptF [Terriglobales bacterium]